MGDLIPFDGSALENSNVKEVKDVWSKWIGRVDRIKEITGCKDHSNFISVVDNLIEREADLRVKIDLNSRNVIEHEKKVLEFKKNVIEIYGREVSVEDMIEIIKSVQILKYENKFNSFTNFEEHVGKVRSMVEYNDELCFKWMEVCREIYGKDDLNVENLRMSVKDICNLEEDDFLSLVMVSDEDIVKIAEFLNKVEKNHLDTRSCIQKYGDGWLKEKLGKLNQARRVLKEEDEDRIVLVEEYLKELNIETNIDVLTEILKVKEDGVEIDFDIEMAKIMGKRFNGVDTDVEKTWRDYFPLVDLLDKKKYLKEADCALNFFRSEKKKRILILKDKVVELMDMAEDFERKFGVKWDWKMNVGMESESARYSYEEIRRREIKNPDKLFESIQNMLSLVASSRELDREIARFNEVGAVNEKNIEELKSDIELMREMLGIMKMVTDEKSMRIEDVKREFGNLYDTGKRKNNAIVDIGESFEREIMEEILKESNENIENQKWVTFDVSNLVKSRQ